MKIKFEDIRVGDRVRLTNGDEVHEFTVEDVRPGGIVHSAHNAYVRATGWEVERMEKPIVLPTGKHALVAHPNSDSYVAYILVDKKWYRINPEGGTDFKKVSGYDVVQAIRVAGLEIVYEGAKESNDE